VIRGVFLDLYDTLIVTSETTASDWLDEFHTCLQSYGLSMSKEVFAERCRGFFSKAEPQKRNDGLTVYERRIKTLSTELGLEIDPEGLKRTAASTVEAANRNCYLDPECHTVLNTLRQKQKTLALISNFDHSPNIRAILYKMDLGKYFSTVIVSEQVGIKKPDPGIFLLALRETGLKPEEVVHVGDNMTDDIAGAVSAGITPVLIRRNLSGQNNMSSVLNDYPAGQDSFGSSIPMVIKTIRRLIELVDVVS
jgi:HAD superfamily hydrolase (TIGR01549 family)